MISIIFILVVVVMGCYGSYISWQKGVEEGGNGFQVMLNEDDYKIIAREALEFLTGQEIKKTTGSDSPFVIIDTDDHEVEFEYDGDIVDTDGDTVPKKEDMN